MAATFLDGISIENFRAIGSKAFIGPFQDINFFIGPNNAGKSTVLFFLAKYLHAAKNENPWGREFSSEDVRLGKGISEINFSFGVSGENLNEEALGLPKKRYRIEIEAVLRMLTKSKGLLWLEGTSDKRESNFLYEENDLDVLDNEQWKRLWKGITQVQSSSVDWGIQTLRRIAQRIAPNYPKVHLIPAIREVSEKGLAFNDYSGRGLIDKLAELQHPGVGERPLRTKFKEINKFLSEVTGCEDAEIEIPHDRGYILVHMEGKVLPLSALGTGIHELVMIASFCTLLERQIVCVEEPEIHLHPLLQRKLIQYLKANTTNQYFIATHSASVIDAVPASIFSVENVGGDAEIKLCVSPNERHEICRSLGYRASDLLQSNAVIWVEGPTDRIYINHWLKSVADDLREGVDYSIMFYGGRLLAHLSANDEEVNDFISLRRLNRNVGIVIDSDRAGEGAAVNATKRRVARELRESFSWVTAGREIENYVPDDVLQRALATEYPKFDRPVGVSQYDRRLHFIEKTGETFKGVDKVKIARRVAREPADLSQLDLRKKISALEKFIRSAGRVD